MVKIGAASQQTEKIANSVTHVRNGTITKHVADLHSSTIAHRDIYIFIYFLNASLILNEMEDSALNPSLASLGTVDGPWHPQEY